MTAQELQEAHAMWEELDAADWRDTSVEAPADPGAAILRAEIVALRNEARRYAEVMDQLRRENRAVIVMFWILVIVAAWGWMR